MSIHLIESLDKNTLYCTGSFTKLLTTFVSLSLLSERYQLENILDDHTFFDNLCANQASQSFLHLFQGLLKKPFTLRDICSHYAGLPYTFDVCEAELNLVEAGKPFKHHHILDENTFLSRCKNNITPVYQPACKFHYSEISIIFLGYLIEKVYGIKIEGLYQKYLIHPFNLSNSLFSRTLPPTVLIKDLSDEYDYPAIAITDHGYFCYSNGFYTTLNDEKKLVEGLIKNSVFQSMIDVNHARAASNRLLNGLSIEIRLKDKDILLGYEGLSFSGCNLWAYSKQKQTGYLAFTDNEETIYPLVYDHLGGDQFDVVPHESQILYQNFIKHYPFNDEKKETPEAFQGDYHRVNINDKTLTDIFSVGKHSITIRNPERITYDLLFTAGVYRIQCKDRVHGSKIGFIQSQTGRHYFYFDGNLYVKIKRVE